MIVYKKNLGKRCLRLCTKKIWVESVYDCVQKKLCHVCIKNILGQIYGSIFWLKGVNNCVKNLDRIFG